MTFSSSNSLDEVFADVAERLGFFARLPLCEQTLHFKHHGIRLLKQARTLFDAGLAAINQSAVRNVFPVAATPSYISDQADTDAKAGGNRCEGKATFGKKGFNLCELSLRQLYARVFVALRHTAKTFGVSTVLSRCHPLKIFHAVVGFDTILVVYRSLSFWIRDKRPSHQPMHRNKSPLFRVTNQSTAVTRSVQPRLQCSPHTPIGKAEFACVTDFKPFVYFA